MKAYLTFNSEEHLLSSINWVGSKVVHVTYQNENGGTVTVFHGSRKSVGELNHTDLSRNIIWEEDKHELSMGERTIKYLYSPKRETVGDDLLGNEVLPGDEVLVYNGEFLLVEGLTNQTKEVMELLGSTYEQAK
ncbi:hypothetical protein [Virgibacillus halodenitrificans]|uniref:hypothetical protein n=1 Tax=Virgibacillus halodenitrificans TaxID=1482 RepID=UPI000EF46C11|nr:hypothetical protein [Virgibacillus halodenitrificans]